MSGSEFHDGPHRVHGGPTLREQDAVGVPYGEIIGGQWLSKRHAKMVRGYVKALGDGYEGDAALLQGALNGGMGGASPMGESTKVARMKALFADPDIKAATRAVYAEVGFPTDEALTLDVAHMRGYTDAEGGYHPPNYTALKDHLKRVLPESSRKLEVLTSRVPAPRLVREDGSPPPMMARPVGEVIEHE